jgi:hypothetical protein
LLFFKTFGKNHEENHNAIYCAFIKKSSRCCHCTPYRSVQLRVRFSRPPLGGIDDGTSGFAQGGGVVLFGNEEGSGFAMAWRSCGRWVGAKVRNVADNSSNSVFWVERHTADQRVVLLVGGIAGDIGVAVPSGRQCALTDEAGNGIYPHASCAASISSSKSAG